MDVRTNVGYIIIAGVVVSYFWLMQRQYQRLQRGHRPRSRWFRLRGIGLLLYNMLETLFIATTSFFALHVGYVLIQSYRLVNVQYGLIGIGIGIAALIIGRLLLILLRSGPTHVNRFLAAGWISILGALLAFGIWAIFSTAGKVLEYQPPQHSLDLLVNILIPAITFIAWMAWNLQDS